jgi:hypothetical protein
VSSFEALFVLVVLTVSINPTLSKIKIECELPKSCWKLIDDHVVDRINQVGDKDFRPLPKQKLKRYLLEKGDFIMKSFLFLASAIFFATAANAQINFNNVTYTGTGCPQGTVSTAVSPDGSSLSILFDEFRAEVPQYDGNNDNSELPRGRGNPRNRNTVTLAHKRCALSFTATLPPNVKADSLEISMQARGATYFDNGIEGAFASVLVGYDGLARSRGNPTTMIMKHWRGNKEVAEDWTESPRNVVPLQSGCSSANGKDIRFDLKNHIQAEIIDGNVQKHGLITVDSTDMKGLLKFTLRTTSCRGR